MTLLTPLGDPVPAGPTPLVGLALMIIPFVTYVTIGPLLRTTSFLTRSPQNLPAGGSTLPKFRLKGIIANFTFLRPRATRMVFYWLKVTL